MDQLVWQRNLLANRLQSLLLLAVMGGLLALLGWLLLGQVGIVLLLSLGLGLLLVNPMVMPSLIMRLYRAQPLHPQQVPLLSQALTQLTMRAGLAHIPSLYYVPSRMINAFTVGGRDQAVIAVTDGFLKGLSPREAVAVLAHEVSHIRNDDMWVMGVADMVSRLTGILSLAGQFLLLLNLPLLLFTEVAINWWAIALLVLAPNISALSQLGLSRTREYGADLNAAHLTGDPAGLASALVKVDRQTESIFERLLLPGRRVPEPSLLRTHPPTQKRVKRLLEMQQATGRESLYRADGPLLHAPAERQVVLRRSPRWHITGLWH